MKLDIFKADGLTYCTILKNEHYTLPLTKIDGSITSKIKVPKGFTCDGASIPKFLWKIFGHPLEGDIVRAAVLHDYLYRTKRTSRKNADWLFFTIMREDGVGFIKRSLMWLAVRLFGGFCYGQE